MTLKRTSRGLFWLALIYTLVMVTFAALGATYALGYAAFGILIAAGSARMW